MATQTDTAIGAVGLTVADLDGVADFYERAVGLRVLGREHGLVRLGATADRPLIELAGDPAAPPAPRHSTGLFHVAILVPDRAELAAALRRLIGAGARLSGASDHLVSEALYLDDPEGNGIEIYRDRSPSEWTYDGGEVRMATLPLDIEDLIAEPAVQDPVNMPPATTIGHVHLRVAELSAAEAFYTGVLGLEVRVRTYPGALFVASGGYHHHIGLNTWTSAGAPPPPDGSRGLQSFELLSSANEVEAIVARAMEGGLQTERHPSRAVLRDPSGNAVVLSAVV